MNISQIDFMVLNPIKIDIPTDNLENKIKRIAFSLGSILTEPFCKTRECLVKIKTVDSLNPSASKCAILIKKFFLLVKAIGWSAVGLITTLPGLFLRKMTASLEKKPYLYAEGSTPHLSPMTSKEVSLLSWNVCCIGAGYSISDGGVTPPTKSRLDEIVNQIANSNSDVNCLYEVFDVITAKYLCDELKKNGYNHFFYNIGAGTLGTSSGIFVASRYEIGDPEFTSFPSSTLPGRTKFANKGVFSFTLVGRDAELQRKPLARIYATHLSHSEKPGAPTDKEKAGRKRQLEIIQALADKVGESLPQIITGDLNLNEEELAGYEFLNEFSEGDVTEKENQTTWEGDYWCATHVENKTPSSAQNLDFTIGKNVELKTNIPFATHYDPSTFSTRGLSDHNPIRSTFTIGEVVHS